MARSEFELETNKNVYSDVIHYPTQDGFLLLIFHLMDEASRWKMLELLQDKRYESFRRALQQWFRIFDSPERLVSDQESALGSEEMVVWLEGKKL